MKTQHESPIQFSGYPLRIVLDDVSIPNTDLIVVKSPDGTATLPVEESLANNPKNWDVDWFNSYE
ncbi:MAG: hypothetical protein ACXVLT_09640 [Flavisolibacter sp.]